MSKLRNVLLSCAVLLPITALAGEMKAHGQLKGHKHLIAAEEKLHAAAKSISKSQEANECVFGVEGGHGKEAKADIEGAEKQVWEAAEWVNTHLSDCDTWAKKKHEPVKGPAEPKLKGHPNLKHHSNLIAAEKDLIAAFEEIEKSQQANECVFGIEGGHGNAARADIDKAFKQVTEAAEWVNTHAKDCDEYAKKKK
jgi:hypothetical protein